MKKMDPNLKFYVIFVLICLYSFPIHLIHICDAHVMLKVKNNEEASKIISNLKKNGEYIFYYYILYSECVHINSMHPI